MKPFKLFLALFLLMLVIHQNSYSWEHRKTLQELSSSAPLIVLGEVLEVTPKVEAYLGQEDFIMTYVRFAVKRVLKGSPKKDVLTLKIPGGQIGDRIIGGAHNFRFDTGEEALLFLSPIEKDYYEIFSISGRLALVNKGNGEYLDCSLLAEDNVSKYGPATTIRKTKIISRINTYLVMEGGE